jgi:hypothetical protein
MKGIVPKRVLFRNFAPCMALLVPAVAAAQAVVPETKLTPMNATNGDGGAVAISGNTVVVANSQASRTYIFTRQGSSWSQQVVTNAGDSGAIGGSVAASGNTFVVAQAGDRDYNAHVYVKANCCWGLQTNLHIPNDYYVDQALALSGDILLAGSIDTSSYQGSAYVFVRNGGVWTQEAQLSAGTGLYLSVALDGGTAVLGSVGDRKAFVYVRADGSWSKQAELSDPDSQTDDFFGQSVAINGNTIVVGAPFRNTGAGSQHGVAVVFVRSGATWSVQATLNPDPNNSVNDPRFGSSVSISGDLALVGTPYYWTPENGEIGAAWVFARSGTHWEGQQLVPTHVQNTAENFAASVAIDGYFAVVGAPELYTTGRPGSAYFYDGSGVCARFARCDPMVLWVDFAYAGAQNGCVDQPYNNLQTATASAPTGGSLALKPGSTAEAPTISKRLRLEACGGPVRIGKQ